MTLTQFIEQAYALVDKYEVGGTPLIEVRVARGGSALRFGGASLLIPGPGPDIPFRTLTELEGVLRAQQEKRQADATLAAALDACEQVKTRLKDLEGQHHLFKIERIEF